MAGGRVRRVVSGGQAGVDRAALDVALALGMACGGWCPRGRAAEDGPIAARYPMAETPSSRSLQRTRWNVRDSDGTLVLLRGRLDGGTLEAARHATEFGRPLHIVDLEGPADDVAAAATRHWLRARRIAVLNVAGPRESSRPGIHLQAADFLRALLGSVRSES